MLPIGVGIAGSADLREIRLNTAMAEMLGSPNAAGPAVRDPLAPQPFTFLRRDQPVSRRDMPMEKAVRDRVAVTEELDLERADGTRISLLEFAAPLMEGDEVRGAVAAMVDVTAVRLAQAEATRAEASLQAAGGSVPFGIWTADTDGQFISVSDSYCQMLGETPGEVLAGRWLKHLAPQWRELAQFDWLECVRAQRAWDYEHELLGSDGEWHTVLQRGRPLIDEGGVFHGYAGINLDITDLKKMQRDLSLTVDQLRRANEVKDELLGLVSHELRTPLTTIFGNAEALRRHHSKIKTADRVQALQDIEDDATRLQRLIENMLVLARVEGPDPGTAEPLLLQRLLPRIATDAKARGVRNPVSIDVPAGLPAVSAQQTYVEQVVGNLVSNAAKYSAPDRPIELVARSDGESVSVLVEDRGGGITEQEAQRIFAPFYRLERTAEQAGGIGLGLAVCKRLIETQGGRIWAEPRKGGGTTIGFTLPIEREYERQIAEALEADE